MLPLFRSSELARECTILPHLLFQLDAHYIPTQDALSLPSKSPEPSIAALTIHVLRPPRDPHIHTPTRPSPPAPGPYDASLLSHLLQSLPRSLPKLRLFALRISTSASILPWSATGIDQRVNFDADRGALDWWTLDSRSLHPRFGSGTGVELGKDAPRGWRPLCVRVGTLGEEALRNVDFEQIADFDAWLAERL